MFSRQPTRLAVCVCVLVLVVVAGGAVATVAATQSGGATELSSVDADEEFAVDTLAAQQDALESDRIRIDITLNADGSASWNIEFWSVLDDDDSEQAFESLQDDIASDPDNYTAEFASRIDDTVATASQSTGRAMTASEFTVETDRQSVSREYGIVTYGFEWDGFGTVDSETIQAGDAIDGLFLDDDSRLLIRWPAEYELDSVEPEPDDERANAVLWRGSNTEFLAGEPRLTVSQPLLGVGSGTLAISLALTASILAVAGWLLRRRSTDSSPAPAAAADDSADMTDSTSGDAHESSTVPDTPSSAPDKGSTAADSEPQTANEAPSNANQSVDDSTEPDPELLSNEEQVMRLLEANGGRMKQQTIVQELGWTDAKTSKVVSTLREEEKLESFRIGRENVLRVADENDERSSL